MESFVIQIQLTQITNIYNVLVIFIQLEVKVHPYLSLLLLLRKQWTRASSCKFYFYDHRITSVYLIQKITKKRHLCIYNVKKDYWKEQLYLIFNFIGQLYYKSKRQGQIVILIFRLFIYLLSVLKFIENRKSSANGHRDL
jgi:hypothetical protein